MLAQNVGNVIGAESTCGVSFPDGSGDCLGTVVTNQLEQLANLPGQGAVRVGELSQI